MPRYKKPGTGKDFQPGNPGGPGRTPVPPELKAAKKLTAQLFQDCVNKLTQMSVSEVRAYLKTEECTSLEAMIAGQIKAAMDGKSAPIGLLLDRTIGPIRHQFQVALSGDLEVRNSTLTKEQAEAEAEKILQRIKARCGSKTPGTD